MKIKNKYIILIALLILTATILPNYWQLGMTAMVGFFLAYLTKGQRARKIKN